MKPRIVHAWRATILASGGSEQASSPETSTLLSGPLTIESPRYDSRFDRHAHWMRILAAWISITWRRWKPEQRSIDRAHDLLPSMQRLIAGLRRGHGIAAPAIALLSPRLVIWRRKKHAGQDSGPVAARLGKRRGAKRPRDKLARAAHLRCWREPVLMRKSNHFYDAWKYADRYCLDRT